MKRDRVSDSEQEQKGEEKDGTVLQSDSRLCLRRVKLLFSLGCDSLIAHPFSSLSRSVLESDFSRDV